MTLFKRLEKILFSLLVQFTFLFVFYNTKRNKVVNDATESKQM